MKDVCNFYLERISDVRVRETVCPKGSARYRHEYGSGENSVAIEGDMANCGRVGRRFGFQIMFVITGNHLFAKDTAGGYALNAPPIHQGNLASCKALRDMGADAREGLLGFFSIDAQLFNRLEMNLGRFKTSELFHLRVTIREMPIQHCRAS